MNLCIVWEYVYSSLCIFKTARKYAIVIVAGIVTLYAGPVISEINQAQETVVKNGRVRSGSALARRNLPLDPIKLEIFVIVFLFYLINNFIFPLFYCIVA